MMTSELTRVLARSSMLAAGVAALLGASVAEASVTYPGPFVGATLTYSDVVEASADPIEDPEPLYGPPSIVSGDNLDFNPLAAAFAADSPPPDTTDGSLTFDLATNSPLDTLGILTVSESGDYTFTGAAPAGELVAATLFVRVLDAVTEAELTTATSSFTELYDSGPLEAGVWSNSVAIDLSSFSASSVKVVVNNLLQATGSGGNTGLIRKTDFDINVPEPASAMLLAGAGLLLARRRK